MSTKYILAGGYIQNASDKGEAFCHELVKDVNKESIKILDCMFARPKKDWQETIKKDTDFFSRYLAKFELVIADPDNFPEQVKEADIIFLRGGFTLPLMEALSKDISWAKELGGKVVAGTSAGAEVLAKYYHVLKTNRTGDGFGLIPIKFVPHWKSVFFDGETQNLDWDKILQELKEYKEDLPVLTLAEGEFKVFES